MVTKPTFLTFIIRIFIISFWVFAIIFFLSLGRVASWFANKRAISVLTWTRVIDEQKVKEFERRTGITVYLNYFESNEELLTKLRFSNENYDLIMPSDFMTEKLIQDGMLKKLNKRELASILETISPELLGHYFDPNNDYSIPCLWDLYGIGINKNFFN